MVYHVIFTARVPQAFLKTIILHFSVEKENTHDFPKSAVLTYFTSSVDIFLTGAASAAS